MTQKHVRCVNEYETFYDAIEKSQVQKLGTKIVKEVAKITVAMICLAVVTFHQLNKYFEQGIFCDQ